MKEYENELFDYLNSIPTKVDPLYMDKQPELRWDMRSVLVDWLVQVHKRYRLASLFDA